MVSSLSENMVLFLIFSGNVMALFFHYILSLIFYYN